MTVKVMDLEGLDLDQPVFRIFPLWFFEQALRTRALTFVSPSKWDDPFEDVCSNIVMSDRETRKQQQLAPHLTPVFAQCWSFERNSDILLRAYSQVSIDPTLGRNRTPGTEGVRVQSTPRKIIHALNGEASKHGAVEFYLGRVKYCTSQQAVMAVQMGLREFGAEGMAQPDKRADTLFLKSDYYRHEDELRVLAIGKERSAAADPLYQVQFDPGYVFEAVEFDPRLATFERREREQMAIDLGYAGPFTGNERAGRILFLVEMPKGLPKAPS